MNFVIGNEKGGVGKSMLAINIAAGIQRAGHTAVLVDTDSTATTSDWYRIRSSRKIEPNIPCIAAPDHPEAVLLGLASQYDNLVIDICSRDYKRMCQLAKISGFWLAPTRVAQGDMDSTLRLYSLLRQLPATAGGKVPFYVVLNATPVAWKSTEEAEAREYMNTMAPSMNILTNTLRERRAWRDVGKSGHSIYELPRRDSGKATDEWTALFSEIMENLNHQSSNRSSA